MVGQTPVKVAREGHATDVAIGNWHWRAAHRPLEGLRERLGAAVDRDGRHQVLQQRQPLVGRQQREAARQRLAARGQLLRSEGTRAGQRQQP